MPDVFNTAKRSEVMSRIRGKGNTTTELGLSAAFRRAGITGWRRHVVLKLKLMCNCGGADRRQKALVVKPDFIFRRAKLAVFVDGCFWHQCPLHSTMPVNNRKFWEQKLRRNVERDKAANKALKSLGWEVLRFWEHDLKQADHIANRLKRRIAVLTPALQA